LVQTCRRITVACAVSRTTLTGITAAIYIELVETNTIRNIWIGIDSQRWALGSVPILNDPWFFSGIP